MMMRRSMARTTITRWGIALLLAWSGPTSTTFGQQFVERTYQDAAGPHKYQVFVPAGYAPQRPVPAILFLHGAGERGTDGRKPTMIGLGPYIQARGASFPFLAIFPQAEDLDGRLLTPWTAGQPDAERALKILEEVQRTYAVDPRRVALVGWSMGGYGAWSLGAAHPEKWSAVVPISGGGDPASVAALKDVPVWAFHGAKDGLVPVEQSRAMVEGLKTAGGTVHYTEFPSAGHELFAETFGNDGLIRWLEAPRERPAELVTVSTPLQVVPPPFVPALELPDAVGVRLGNDVLQALSYAAPSLVPANLLSGRLNDMFDGTSVQGRSFSVRFSGISYYGQLERVQIQAAGRDRVNIQLGLRNITLSIAGTSVSGQRHSASAGPISIGIGHNRAVWLSIDVAPYVENRQLRLRLIGSNFSIPPDSYYVTQPAGVSVQGIGMTRERVTSGIVSGLYGARGRVENEVRAIVPNLVAQLERQLTITDPGPIVAAMWPLPVYSPRLRAYPVSATTDAEGITLSLGLTAAHVDPTTPAGTVRTVTTASGTTALAGKELGVSLAPGVLGPLSQLVVDAGLASIDLRDLPEPGFHRLADRDLLTELLPELQSRPADEEVRARLVFREAFDVSAESATDAVDQVPVALKLPKVSVVVSTRAVNATWQPFAEFDLSLEDAATATLDKPHHELRGLGLKWSGAPRLTGTGRYVYGGTPGDSMVDAERFTKLFQESWQAWITRQSGGTSTVPDVVIGATKLRLERLKGTAGRLVGTFDVPTIKLTNLSEEPFVYETKGPYSGWGGPYTLAPGTSQEYKIPYPLTYRRSGAAGNEFYTLFTGTHSEYRVPWSGGPPRLFTAKRPE